MYGMNPDWEIQIEILRRTFAELDNQILAKCPQGCLAVMFMSEHEEPNDNESAKTEEKSSEKEGL